MTSFIAAGGSGRSTSFIPAVPAAWSVTTIALMNFSAVISLCWQCCGVGMPAGRRGHSKAAVGRERDRHPVPRTQCLPLCADLILLLHAVKSDLGRPRLLLR